MNDLVTAIQQRRAHQLDPTDWAERCITCDEPWPCPTWRTARSVVLASLRAAFAAARTGTVVGRARVIRRAGC